MKVYLFNRGGSLNIGDQLIDYVTSSFLESYNWDVAHNKVYPLSPNELATHLIHLHSYLNDVKQLLKCDFLIIGGGNLIMDSAGLNWAIHHFWLSLWCLILRKKYYYLFVGANPLRRNIAKILYRFVLKFAAGISVRDSGSQAYLRQFTGRDDITLMFDPVLTIASVLPQQVAKHNAIGLCPVQFYNASISMNVEFYQRYVQLYVKLVESFLDKGKTVYLFLNDTETDQPVLKDITQRLDKVAGLYVKDHFNGFADYLSFIASLDFVVSSRMHAIICATSYGIPAIGLGWQPKMRDFFDDQGLQGHIDILQNFRSNYTSMEILQNIIRLYELKKDEVVMPTVSELNLAKFFGIE